MNKNHLSLSDFDNRLLKSMYVQPLTPDGVLEVLNNNFRKGLITEELYETAVLQLDELVKARVTKYYKREGGPGNYKYYYTKAEYDEAKGKKTEEKSKEHKKEPEQSSYESRFSNFINELTEILNHTFVLQYG